MNDPQRITTRIHPAASQDGPPKSVETPSHEPHLVALMSVSSGMVGACLTAIGLIGIVKSLNRAENLVDDSLAIATLFFTTAALLSFVGMRTRIGRSWRHLVLTLDIVFCLGMLLTFLAALLLTWVVI